MELDYITILEYHWCYVCMLKKLSKLVSKGYLVLRKISYYIIYNNFYFIFSKYIKFLVFSAAQKNCLIVNRPL